MHSRGKGILKEEKALEKTHRIRDKISKVGEEERKRNSKKLEKNLVV